VTLNRGFCFALILGLAVVTQGQADDYYFYKGPKGGLVISNQKLPPGTTITKRSSFPDAPDNEAPQNQPSNKAQPNGPIESSPRPPKGK
jgi:hypothetical protein